VLEPPLPPVAGSGGGFFDGAEDEQATPMTQVSSNEVRRRVCETIAYEGDDRARM
jgi:hypothetical protein